MKDGTDAPKAPAPKDMTAIRVVYFLLVVPMLLVMVFVFIVPTNLDSSQMDKALAPIVLRDYPGWHYKDFTY